MIWVAGLIASYLTARTFDWDIIWGVAAVATLYMLSQGGSASGIGGAVGAVTSGIGGAFRSIWRLVVGVMLFVALMIVVGKLTGVSPAQATAPFVLWLSVAVLAAGITARAVAKRPGVALAIFAVSATVAFTAIWMPRLGEEVRPKPTNTPTVVGGGPPHAYSRWDETDQALAENGVIPVVAGVVWRFAGGGVIEDALAGDAVLSRAWDRTKVKLFGAPAPRAPRTPLPPSATPAPPAPVVRTFTTPVELPLGCGWRLIRSDDTVMVSLGAGSRREAGPFRFSAGSFADASPTPNERRLRPIRFEADGAGSISFEVEQTSGRCW